MVAKRKANKTTGVPSIQGFMSPAKKRISNGEVIDLTNVSPRPKQNSEKEVIHVDAADISSDAFAPTKGRASIDSCITERMPSIEPLPRNGCMDVTEPPSKGVRDESYVELMRILGVSKKLLPIRQNPNPKPVMAFNESILGRSVPGNDSSVRSTKKVDLGINYKADGISRKHLVVHQISKDRVIFKISSSVKNITEFVRGRHTHQFKKLNYVEAGIGDIIVFDPYFNDDGTTNRHHIFEIVKLSTSPSTGIGQRNNFTSISVQNNSILSMISRGNNATKEISSRDNYVLLSKNKDREDKKLRGKGRIVPIPQGKKQETTQEPPKRSPSLLNRTKDDNQDKIRTLAFKEIIKPALRMNFPRKEIKNEHPNENENENVNISACTDSEHFRLTNTRQNINSVDELRAVETIFTGNEGKTRGSTSDNLRENHLNKSDKIDADSHTSSCTVKEEVKADEYVAGTNHVKNCDSCDIEVKVVHNNELSTNVERLNKKSDDLSGSDKSVEYSTKNSDPAALSLCEKKKRKSRSLLLDSDRLCVTEFTYNCLNQMELCYDSVLSKIGIQCMHCRETPNCYCVFPSNSRHVKNCVKDTEKHMFACMRVPEHLSIRLENLKNSLSKQYLKVQVQRQEDFYGALYERISNADIREIRTVAAYSPDSCKPQIRKTAKHEGRDTEETQIAGDVTNSEKIVSNKIREENNMKTLEIIDSHKEVNEGDRISVKFECPDMFDIKREQWYFGTATRVIRDANNVCRLEIIYDDKTEDEMKFPNEDALKIREQDDGSMVIEGTDEIVCSPPKDLGAGDLVDCRHQNRVKWWRGRVVRVDSNLNLCDILYDDGVYEESIPILSNNIRLVSRGWKDPDWLVGIQYLSPNASKKWSVKEIVGIEKCKHITSSRDIKLCVQTWRKTNIKSYNEVLENLFTDLIDETEDKFWWPRAQLEQEKESPDSFGDACAALEPDRVKSVLVKDDSSSEDIHDLDLKNKYKPKTLHPDESKIVSPLGTPIRENETDSCSNISQTSKEIISPREMHACQGHSYWSAFSSAEPENGYDLLVHGAVVYKHAPNKYLNGKVSDAIINGLKSEGISLVDANKSELKSRYFNLLQNMFLGSRCDDSFSFPTLKWVDVEKCLTIADEVVKYPSRHTIALLQTSCVCIEHISDRFDIGRKQAQRGLQHVSQVKNTLSLFEGGLRAALKFVVKWTARSWTLFGPLLLSEGMSHTVNNNIVLSRWLLALGRLISLMTWFFCEDEKLEFTSTDSLYLIHESFLSEVTKVDLLKNESLSKRKALMRDIKLHFLLSIKDDVTPRMKYALGRIFKVEKEMSIIAGD